MLFSSSLMDESIIGSELRRYLKEGMVTYSGFLKVVSLRSLRILIEECSTEGCQPGSVAQITGLISLLHNYKGVDGSS